MAALKTNNQDWGFFGTIALANCDQAQEAWDMAMEKLEAETSHTPEDIRTWLDSRSGRHFADNVVEKLRNESLEESIDAAIKRWNSWKPSNTQRKNGAPSWATYLQADIMEAVYI